MNIPGTNDEFICIVPEPTPPEQELEEAKAKTPAQTIQELKTLLKGMDTACLYKLDGWWTYEFCSSRGTIRQFHSTDGNVEPEHQHFLGRRLDATLTDLTPTYLSETYDDGSVCDLTNAKRTIEVRYSCDASREVSWIDKLAEPMSCKYTLFVHTPLLCSHRHFGALQTPVTNIRCQLASSMAAAAAAAATATLFDLSADSVNSHRSTLADVIDSAIFVEEDRMRKVLGVNPLAPHSRVASLASVALHVTRRAGRKKESEEGGITFRFRFMDLIVRNSRRPNCRPTTTLFQQQRASAAAVVAAVFTASKR
jgi:hypothetical protein